MSINALYFNNISIEKTAHELTQVHSICPHHVIRDSYASPAFSEWKKGALTLDDIPMRSYTIDDGNPIREELHKAPWEDSIKNFIFDVVSLNTSSKFQTCILLSEIGYKYQEATIHTIAGKYGKDNVTLLDIIPCTPDIENSNYEENYYEFKLRVRHKDVNYESIIDKTTLVSTLAEWYIPEDTVIFCHDSFITEYQEAISIMPESTWSIACTYTNYIVNKSGKECNYICPNFACPGSLETRAVSSGTAVFTDENAPPIYTSKLNYYSRCVRTSKHFSGKCFDCKILERTIEDIYKSPLSTPVNNKFVNFTPTFNKFLDDKGSRVFKNVYDKV